mgnify:CR=1 FL=1
MFVIMSVTMTTAALMLVVMRMTVATTATLMVVIILAMLLPAWYARRVLDREIAAEVFGRPELLATVGPA